MDTQVKAVAGLSREQVKQTIQWLTDTGNHEAAATIYGQYCTCQQLSLVESAEFNRELAVESGNPDNVAKADFSIQVGSFLLEAGYPEKSALKLMGDAGCAWNVFYRAFSHPPVVVSVASSETIDIGIPGFYFVKP